MSMLTAAALEHVHSPRNVGPLDGASHYGKAWADWAIDQDGPSIELWLTVRNDTIEQAAYQANGCPSSIACGSMLAQIITGRTVEQALRLEPADIALLLGGLPEGKEYCAQMSVRALTEALECFK